MAALVLALAALAGLQEALRGEVLARTPHLEVELPEGAEAEEAREWLLSRPGVEGVRELVRGRGWLRAGGLVQPVEIVGYGGELPRFFPGVEGAGAGAYVGDDLAGRWGLEAGDTVQVISPRMTLSPVGPQPRARSVRLAGTFASGRTEEVERVAIPLEVARPLVATRGTRLELSTADLDRALALRSELEAGLPEGSLVRTWRELNRPLFFALRLEKGVTFVAVSLIVVVAALALVADLALVITSKRAELGMLAAMGAAPARLRRAFVLLGAVLAALGIAAGAAAGGCLAVVLDRFQLVRLPNQVYFLDYLPFRLEAGDLAAVLLTTLLLALGSAAFVAQRVGRGSPVEALRR